MSIQATDAETYKLLQEYVNDPSLGGDDFRVRVDFKAHPAGMLSRFAIFQHVRFDQIAVPEPWLQQVSGNAKGHFIILVSSEAAVSKTLGGALTVVFNTGRTTEPRFDWAVADSEEYQGPRDVVFPSRDTTPVTTPGTTPAPAGSTSRTPSSMGELVPLLQEIVRNKQATGPDPFARMIEMQAEDRRRDESRRAEERERAEKRDEREREREEQRRREDREREDKKEERDRQYRLEMAAASQKSNEMMMQLLTREPPKDPVRDALLTKAINGGDEAAMKTGALITQMGGFMSQMTGMTVQLLHTQAELNQGNQPESPMWGLAGKLVEGYFGMQGAQEEELAEALAETAEKKALPTGEEASEPAEEGETTPEPMTEEPSVENPLQRLDRAIRQEAPLKELADALCMAMVTPDFQAIYLKYKGNVQKLVIERYGDWLAASDVKGPERKDINARRVKYLSSNLPKAYRVAQQRGIVKPPPAKKDSHAKPQPQAKKPEAKIETKKETTA